MNELEMLLGQVYSGGGQGGGGGGGESTIAWRPSVSADGTISWTRTSSTTAPTPVNVKGEKGDTGATGEKGETGEKGADGAKGDDGFSPTITVTEITGGHRVTVTDAEGSESFDVMDGQGGGGSTATLQEMFNDGGNNALVIESDNRVSEAEPCFVIKNNWYGQPNSEWSTSGIHFSASEGEGRAIYGRGEILLENGEGSGFSISPSTVDMSTELTDAFKAALSIEETFTQTEKEKLEGLSNYDDTVLSARVTANETAIADRYTKAETDDLIEGEHIELTQAQYTALPEEEKMNGKTYFITDGGAYVPAVDLIPYVNQSPIVVGKLDLRGDGEFRDIKRVRLWINDLKNASEVITAGWAETGVYVRPIRIYGWFTFHDTEETQTSWTYRIQQLPIPYSGYKPIESPSGSTIGLKFYVDYNNKLRMVVEGKSNFHTEDHACVIVDFMETPVA